MKATKREREYIEKYGNIPDTQEGRIQYIKDMYHVSEEDIQEDIERIQHLKKKTIQFTIPLVPYGTPRARSSSTHVSKAHFYVKGAAEHKQIIKRIIDVQEIICTKCFLMQDLYLPIPLSQMTRKEILLAEMGFIDPIVNPDIDNLAKTYMDMIQGYLILNDNQVSKLYGEKRYSIKPRIDIQLTYFDGFDCKYNERRVKSSKLYKEFVLDQKTT